jgi:hypothetical protein
LKGAVDIGEKAQDLQVEVGVLKNTLNTLVEND